MFPELTSERFLLQQIISADQQFIFEGLSDPEVIAFYGVSFDSFEATSKQMEFYDNLIKEGTGTWWKIVDRANGNRMGAIGFNNYQSKHRKAEIGYWLLLECWKQGIITEVLPVVLNYMQNQLQIHRIEALVEVGNEQSCRILENAGFIQEGLMRDYEFKNGKFISIHIFALFGK
jgi:[ribosomal protein S5]-alanine N-acetyltransferase